MPDFHVIPSIEQIRQRAGVRSLERRFGGQATVDALRDAAAEVRRSVAAGSDGITGEAAADRIEQIATTRLDTLFQPSLVRVINATGIVIHTNLGRAPLAAAAISRVADVARGYSSLEYDLDAGTRGRRDRHAEALLCRLTGAEAAVVVNNNAAATLIVLAALAAGREAIVSRGELVEIGGGFRIPDVMAQSGAGLREVGTTNKTRASDYGAAISERTALILRVHPSNFRIEGFTERPSLGDLVTLGRKFNILVAEDLGSGNIQQESDGDITVRTTIAAGVDVCWFSGDKLLGGPQAGIVGRAAAIERIREHPLMRALRVDKMTHAALAATLARYAAGRETTTVPVRQMLALTPEEIRVRADALAAAIGADGRWRATVVAGVSAAGGGSAPGVELPTWLVAIAKTQTSPDAINERLRRSSPPVIARIERDQLLLDLRTVSPDDDGLLGSLILSL